MKRERVPSQCSGRSLSLVAWGRVLCVAALLLLPAAQSAAAEAPETQPEFSFGLIADVQYADKDNGGERRYRASLTKLEEAVGKLNRHALAFLANLGDSIDGRGDQSLTDLRRVLDVFTKSQAPVRHVIGNHCLELPRRELMPALGLDQGHYAFQFRGWQFLVLDTMEVSLKSEPGTAQRLEAEAWVANHPELPTYNGALGPNQLAWLKSELTEARKAQRNVVVLSHHPLATIPGHESLLLWNAVDVRQVLSEAGCVVACFAGHDHVGAYVRTDGIHYLTMPGVVEAPTDSNRYAVVDVYRDRLEVRGAGDAPSRTLQFALP